jgi:glutathione S-transferase
VLDVALTRGPWLLGENFSAADIAIGSGLYFSVRLFKMVPARPSFDRYIDACAARPAFQRASVIAAG